MRNGYAVRTYNLQANVAQALPAAREFLIVTASVDITALSIALGDENGDGEQWPLGFAVGVKEGSTKARVTSAVAQTVTIAMADGGVSVVDSRFAPGAGSLAVTIDDGADEALGATTDAVAGSDTGNATLIALIKRLLTKTNVPEAYTDLFSSGAAAGSPAGAATIVNGATNVNGILVSSASVSCVADPTAEYRLEINGVIWLRAVDGQVSSIAGAIVIPAGLPFSFARVGGGNVSATYRIL